MSQVLAVTDFDGLAREAVHTLKYRERFAIAGLLGELMATVARGTRGDQVVAVPLHPARKRERGYNQAYLLGRSVAKHLGLPQTDSLKRTRRTEDQVHLDREGRRANVRNAFQASREPVNGRVLLVDDVVTTGATLDAAAQALLSAGAEVVVGLAFASANLSDGNTDDGVRVSNDTP